MQRDAWSDPGNLQPQNVTEFKEKRRETGPPSGWFSVGQHSEMMGFLDSPTLPLCSPAGYKDQCALTNSESVWLHIKEAGQSLYRASYTQ